MDEVAQAEQDKYRRMWDVPAYRVHSPGLRILGRATQYLPRDKTIIDFGCGSGKAAQALTNQGYKVTGVDLAPNCVDEGCTFPFQQVCLWDLPAALSCSYGYCTDVMEHIPPSKVHDVLKNISRACLEGCFFQIATFQESFGQKIGAILHLSVQPAEVWELALKKHWANVEMLQGGRDAQFWVTH